MKERDEEGAVTAEELGALFGCFWVFPLIILLFVVLYACAATVVEGG